MRDAMLRRYQALPPILRSAVASVRGGYLRAWRYGPETRALCVEAAAREAWTAGEWARWREERLGRLLHRAATRVPYYRDQWAERRRRGDRASHELLANWPVLEKEALRRFPQAFVADDRKIGRMFHDHTSGTTGKSLDLWQTRETVRRWYALYEQRCRRWHGVSRHDPWAIFGGQLVVSVRQAAPPYWVWNAGLRQLYASSYHLSPATAPAYVEALRRRRVRFILGYTSALHVLAREILAQRLEPPAVAVLLANAEPVYGHQRRDIEAAFRAPLRETYGMAEIVTAAAECEHGRMHLWPDVGVTEVLEGEVPVPGGTGGELVCTGLVNEDMPLVRYRVGDRAVLGAEESSCPCGRRLPELASVEGRMDDALRTVDGRLVGRLDPVFKSRLPIVEAQIVQERLDLVRVRYVPAADYTPEAGATIAAKLRERMGDVRVELEAVAAIERTRNGKFRAVVCNLPPEERA